MAAGAPGIRILTLTVAALVCTTGLAHAATWPVGRGERCTTLSSAIALAQPGDTIRVAPGTYREHGLLVDRPLVLTGVGRPAIDADNQGEILTVTASGAVVRGFLFQNVGTSFVEDRAAVRLKNVEGAVVDDNEFDNTFFGVYAEHSSGVLVRGNRLQGPGGREVTAGNGIHLWYCKEARIEDNEIHGHRDGIYFEFVEDSSIRGNVSTGNIRYGLHFMFSHGNEYVENRFAQNGAGVAVMYTQHVKMHGNVFEHNWGTSSYGLLLKDIRDSEIRHNRFVANTVGLYAEGSNRLKVTENEFVDNGYAARIMANSMDNTFSSNNFIGNSFDVVTNSRQSFNTFDANYWSEYDGYDLDGNGVGDVPHHPVRLFSLLVEKAPPGIVLMGSLFVTLIDTAERVMPVFTPETLVDKSPRMTVIVIDDASDSGGSR
jgi:nitrous oxidase accessory protein